MQAFPFESDSVSESASTFDADPASAGEVELERLYAAVVEGIQAGATFKDMHGLSDETMEGIYSQAYVLYTSGRLDEAETFFRFLCIYDFNNVDYALGLGAVLQLKKRYEKALDVYAMAYTIGRQDGRALFYAGQCNFLLRRRGNARRCFELLLETSKDSHLIQKAQGYLSAIKQGTTNTKDSSAVSSPQGV
jgi:type III secretion system low calcium response chaperone LcrH/SycD